MGKHRKPEHPDLKGETDPYRIKKALEQAEAENAREMERIRREMREGK